MNINNYRWCEGREVQDAFGTLAKRGSIWAHCILARVLDEQVTKLNLTRMPETTNVSLVKSLVSCLNGQVVSGITFPLIELKKMAWNSFNAKMKRINKAAEMSYFLLIACTVG
jgi:hypothetical protein